MIAYLRRVWVSASFYPMTTLYLVCGALTALLSGNSIDLGTALIVLTLTTATLVLIADRRDSANLRRQLGDVAARVSQITETPPEGDTDDQ